MTAAEIAATLDTLARTMTAHMPVVATQGCTDRRCTACSAGKGCSR